MPEWSLSLLPGYLFFLIPAAWLFLCVYGLFICRMDRSPLKKAAILISSLFLFTLCYILVFKTSNPSILQALRLAPQTTASRILTCTTTIVWLFMIAVQIRISWRIYLPQTIPNLLSRSEEHAPFQAKADDWNIFRNLNYGEGPYRLKPDSPPPPQNKRKSIPIRRNRHVSAFMQNKPPFSLINQIYDLRVVTIELAFPNLPAAFDGLRIVQLSDPHVWQHLSPKYYEHAIQQASRLKPDLVVITGDFTASNNLYRESAALFTPLAPPMGTFAILGNHDYFTEPELLSFWLEHDNIHTLANKSVRFNRPAPDGTSIHEIILSGTEHPHKRIVDWYALVHGTDTERETDQKAPTETFHITLSHRPDFVKEIARAGGDLVLSGHTHGGQWRLPLLGPIVVPSRHGRHYARGLFLEKNTLLYINSGIGVHTIPLRFRCPPEITLLTLQKQNID